MTYGACGELGKGLVGGSENGIGAVTCESVGKIGGLHRGDKGVERSGRNGGLK
jgi:hypothetical protein